MLTFCKVCIRRAWNDSSWCWRAYNKIKYDMKLNHFEIAIISFYIYTPKLPITRNHHMRVKGLTFLVILANSPMYFREDFCGKSTCILEVFILKEISVYTGIWRKRWNENDLLSVLIVVGFDFLILIYSHILKSKIGKPCDLILKFYF